MATTLAVRHKMRNSNKIREWNPRHFPMERVRMKLDKAHARAYLTVRMKQNNQTRLQKNIERLYKVKPIRNKQRLEGLSLSPNAGNDLPN